MKKYLFNENGICMNPDTIEFYNKNKCLVTFEFAKVGNRWVYGTQLWMTLNTPETYGMHGDGCWDGADPLSLKNCWISAIHEAIDFFQEDKRESKCQGVLNALKNKLSELTKKL